MASYLAGEFPFAFAPHEAGGERSVGALGDDVGELVGMLIEVGSDHVTQVVFGGGAIQLRFGLREPLAPCQIGMVDPR